MKKKKVTDRLAAYVAFHQKFCDEARILGTAKNQDYSAPEREPGHTFAVFRNFLHCQNLGICTVEQGFLVRMSDKLARLANLLRPGHRQGVKTESIKDTLQDLVNYSALLAHLNDVRAASVVKRKRKKAKEAKDAGGAAVISMLFSSEFGEGNAAVGVEVLAGKVLAQDCVHWSEPHPLGWAKLEEAGEFIEARMREDPNFSAAWDESYFTWKEKWGRLEVELITSNDQLWDRYLRVLNEALDKFPGLHKYLSPGLPSSPVWVGPLYMIEDKKKEIGKWTDEQILAALEDFKKEKR